MSDQAPRPLSMVQADALGRAFRRLQADPTTEALAIAERLVDEAPFAPDAHHLLAMSLGQAGRVCEADAAFRRALQLAPAHPLILSNYAAMLRNAGQPAAALLVAERAVLASSSSAKAWLDLALTAQVAGDHGRAVAAARKSLDLHPAKAAWQVLGNASRDSEDLETAVHAFAKAIEFEPEQAAYVNLGAVQRMAGRPDRAITSLEYAIRQLGPAPSLADALAGALLDAGRTQDAIALAERVAYEYPTFIPGLVTLSNLLWEYASGAQAESASADLFRRAIARTPDNAELRAAFARFAMNTRDVEEALVQIRWLRDRDDRPELALMQAQALDALGRPQAARALFESLQRDGADTSVQFLNAYAAHLLSSGEPAAAAPLAMQATGLAPDDQHAWAYLGTAWRLLDDAREHWLCDYGLLVGALQVEPPSEFGSQRLFLDALGAALAPMHRARREPLQQSVRGGSQTPGRLFGRQDPVIEAARGALLQAVEGWLAALPADPAHPFLRRNQGRVRIGGSWSVKLWSSGSHANHIHTEGWMSSAFYVALPPSMHADASQAGAIQFGQPPPELGLALPPRHVVRPEPGKLMLFPSYLWHGTVPFVDDTARVTIAFDMIPRRDEP